MTKDHPGHADEPEKVINPESEYKQIKRSSVLLHPIHAIKVASAGLSRKQGVCVGDEGE